MSILQVSNLHFESTGNNRLQYTGSNSYNIVAGGINAATVNTTSFYANLNFDVAGTFRVNGADVSPIGQQTIWIPAVAMYPRLTNGPIYDSIETTTNKVVIKTLNYDSAAIEYAQFAIQMPKGWNEGSLIPQFIWSHASTTTNFGVTWAIQAVAYDNAVALDAAFGTSTSIADVGGATDTVYITGEASPFTVAGLLVPEEYVIFQVWRNVSDVSDTLAVDARLHGVKIHYTINSAKDD